MNYIRFYRDQLNTSGFTYSHMMRLNDNDWEHYHNYIQWMFPSDEPSMILAHAPTTNKISIKLFNNDIEIQKRFETAFRRYMQHLGLFIVNDTLVPIDKHRGRTYMRVLRRNHNWQRITRVLRSLRLHGRQDLANMLYACLKQFDGITQVAWDYWNRAMEFKANN